MALSVSKQDSGIVDKTNLRLVWEQTETTVRLVVSYFNWIWVHSRKDNTAAQRSGLAITPWSWHDLITFPTLA